MEVIMAVNVDDPKGGKRGDDSAMKPDSTQKGADDAKKQTGVGNDEYAVPPKP
jgi:hypothetical protein